LGRLALTEEFFIAHKAMAARHLEGYDDSVARLYRCYFCTDLFNDAHRLMPKDVPGTHEGGERLV
jgi:hypothetical protein